MNRDEEKGVMVYCRNCRRFLGRAVIANEMWCVRCALASPVDHAAQEKKAS
jgi:hypothetical protein